MQVPHTHLKAAHGITTKEYRAMGYPTLSPARLFQCRSTPVGNGSCDGNRKKYGELHHNWKGGHVNSAGYRIISRRGRSQLYEHRVVAEEMLGRPLASDEIVHHKDGNRLNNSPDNLVVMKRCEHDKMKEGTRAFSHTNTDCEEAAKTLLALGWSKAKICRGLRVHRVTLEKWLAS